MSEILEDIDVSELMSIKLYTVSPDMTAAYADKLMRSKHFGGLPVVQEGKLIGIVTRKDVAKVDEGKRGKAKVESIMTRDVVTISQADNAFTAFEKMSKLRVMRMPVISNVGALVGMVTLTDLERAIKILQNRKLNGILTRCWNCNAPLKVTLSRTIKCGHCGCISNF